MLDALGWFYHKRMEMVVQDKLVAAQSFIAGTVKNELRINNEMFF
jgi:hypothetical protein